MLNSEILEIAIGLVFVYLVTCLAATTIREFVESIVKSRAVTLERGLRQLLDDPDGQGITKDLFAHPLIDSLFPGKYEPERLRGLYLSWFQADTGSDPAATKGASERMPLHTNLPNYIPSGHFALAMLKLVSGDGPLSLQSAKGGAMALPDGPVKTALLTALGDAGDDLDRARRNLEAWYDGTMDRIGGWYKRQTQWILLLIGILLAVSANIDTLRIVQVLGDNNTLRLSLVQSAEKMDAERRAAADAAAQAREVETTATTGDTAATPPPPAGNGEATQATPPPAGVPTSSDSLTDGVYSISQLIGWEHFPDEWAAAQAKGGMAQARFVASKALGWFFTALAVTLGAPFWFDVLNKIMVVRSTVKPFEKSEPSVSKDRAVAAPPAATAPAPEGTAVTAGAAGGAPTVLVRLAVDTQPGDGHPEITVNGKAVPVLAGGLAELELPAGVVSDIVATVDRGGAPVTWRLGYAASLDSEGDALEAVPV